jgi:hypothetical protein
VHVIQLNIIYLQSGLWINRTENATLDRNIDEIDCEKNEERTYSNNKFAFGPKDMVGGVRLINAAYGTGEPSTYDFRIGVI